MASGQAYPGRMPFARELASKEAEMQLCWHLRERAGVVVAGIQHLDTGILRAVERRNNRGRLAWLAAQVERDFRIVEPEAQVVLVRGRKNNRRILIIAKRDGKRLDIENALDICTP